ncbi:MAG: hypothetical protein HYY37_02685 [Candidatus Aenigmarchaeota archaeon]|nr:hypothetical protein [Candidatus Aenigmarchaeota archaeon]
MFFHAKKQETKEIKQAIEEPYPAPQQQEIVQEPAAPMSAPLFVKVEKYREILSDVQEMKVFIEGVKQLLGVVNDVEAVRADAIKMLRATVQRLEKTVTEVDSELLRPKGFEIETPGEIEIRHIEGSLSDLQHQLAALRKELQELH